MALKEKELQKMKDKLLKLKSFVPALQLIFWSS